MKPWELIDTTQVPGSETELRLMRHDRDFYFRLGQTELMSSRVHGSEEVLAEAAIEAAKPGPKARVLVGGLGMGYTLARVLEHIGPQAKAIVYELVPAVIEWNRTHLADLAGRPLDDPRVELIEGDVVPAIRNAQDAFDVILLDVDNGPEGLTHEDNERLYSRPGLAAARRALRPGGILAVWSTHLEESFTKRLRGVGFSVDIRRVKARITKGPRRTIWLAKR